MPPFPRGRALHNTLFYHNQVSITRNTELALSTHYQLISQPFVYNNHFFSSSTFLCMLLFIFIHLRNFHATFRSLYRLCIHFSFSFSCFFSSHRPVSFLPHPPFRFLMFRLTHLPLFFPSSSFFFFGPYYSTLFPMSPV